MIELPKEKTKPVENIEKLNMLLYGIPGCGKSTLCSNIDNGIFIATEAGLNHLETFNIQVNTWLELLEACKLLMTQENEYKTIIIDTIDNLADLCSEYVLEKESKKTNKIITHASDLSYGKGWALIKNEFIRVINKLVNSKFGVVFISHSQDKEFETATGNYVKTIPSITPSISKYLCGLVDIILYCDIDKDQNRILHCNPHSNFEAKDRTGKFPESIILENDKTGKKCWKQITTIMNNKKEGKK